MLCKLQLKRKLTFTEGLVASWHIAFIISGLKLWSLPLNNEIYDLR